ncbi:S1C family serine protease [Alkalicoccobacillus plakortidis]|uniref:Trypsin-like peptidase domain-containing protein n=1 Tax=Alkalicoccobacillus plakortidis TaxID=444060 RepID=A0ABT0XKL2_9BACI|nr:trypsin-like peptidase domain-containing protein [Alkalicoccobacillus plakortidis]MCM2676421.1 trypsin-like peptidase domain-containing protein [Alkalicoccobacillus plakortidis]
MGYYDSQDPNNKSTQQGSYSNYPRHTEPQERQRKPKGRKRTAGLSAFGGAVLGGLIVVFTTPALSNIGWLPYEIESNSPPTEEVGGTQIDNNTGTSQAINLNVSSGVTDAVEKVSDAVVGVTNMQQSDIFSAQEAAEGTGSGVIYKKEGDKAYVVTNNHVVEGANDLTVTLTDGTDVPATLLGADLITDLAVLEIDAEHVDTVATFGNSENLRAGEPTIAIGNPLGQSFASSVTQGIISATERSIPVDLDGDGQPDWNAEVLQTDAAINPGNSGGALININGEVIGINSMKIAQSAVEGIGFSIPTAVAEPIINDLETFGEVKRPQLGVGIRSLADIPVQHRTGTLNLPEDVEEGVVVTSVAPNSSASQAGLQEYDVIVQIDGEDISEGADLRRFLYTDKAVGDTVTVTLYRDGQQQDIDVQLQEPQSF